MEEQLEGYVANYPLYENVKYCYGTAGFRCKADLLQPAAYRMGLLAALR